MIKDNIEKLKRSVYLACAKSKRDFNSVTIVAVSKGRAIEQVIEAVNAGLADIGENKVQEALLKYQHLSPDTQHLTPNTQHLAPVQWHMVGHLQTNKVRDAVRIFDMIHSVDSLRLALAIDAEASRIQKTQDVLIEVNVSGEKSKFGLKPTDVIGVVKSISRLENIKLKGLMTVAPVTEDPKQSRVYFRILREIKDKINQIKVLGHELNVLSMGMTDDFEIAIEEGSTMVRVGRAVFEG